jgi:hypothetical protein
MSLASSALFFAVLVGQTPAPPPSTPVVPPPQGGSDLIGSRTTPDPQSGGSGEYDDRMSDERRHEFGLGATFGLSGRGGGGGFRYFFNDRFGVNALAGYSRPQSIGGSSLGRSVFYVAPSVVYMLTPMNTKADIDLRPYIGGGMSYGGATGTPSTGGSTGIRSNGFGLGGQVFGGVELTFQDAKAVTISAEVAHYEVHSPYSAGPIIRGTNFFLTFHFFLK